MSAIARGLGDRDAPSRRRLGARPRAASSRRTACGSVTAPRIRRGPPQRGHTRTSIANTWRRSEVVPDARVEPSLAGAPPVSRFQFERLGYFSIDPDTTAGRLVVNRTVGLRDTWAKIEKASGG
jgi:tRNA synthetases class I (E and Q), anti-codon binding domain